MGDKSGNRTSNFQREGANCTQPVWTAMKAAVRTESSASHKFQVLRIGAPSREELQDRFPGADPFSESAR
jgi:hypothetical protein